MSRRAALALDLNQGRVALEPELSGIARPTVLKFTPNRWRNSHFPKNTASLQRSEY